MVHTIKRIQKSIDVVSVGVACTMCDTGDHKLFGEKVYQLYIALLS